MSNNLINLPKVKEEDLPIYDFDRQQCCGFLEKKASQSSSFSKGKWQRRWFTINGYLTGIENYSLSYYYNPDDKEARQRFELKKSTVVHSGGNVLTLTFEDH